MRALLPSQQAQVLLRDQLPRAIMEPQRRSREHLFGHEHTLHQLSDARVLASVVDDAQERRVEADFLNARAVHSHQAGVALVSEPSVQRVGVRNHLRQALGDGDVERVILVLAQLPQHVIHGVGLASGSDEREGGVDGRSGEMAREGPVDDASEHTAPGEVVGVSGTFGEAPRGEVEGRGVVSEVSVASDEGDGIGKNSA